MSAYVSLSQSCGHPDESSCMRCRILYGSWSKAAPRFCRRLTGPRAAQTGTRNRKARATRNMKPLLSLMPRGRCVGSSFTVLWACGKGTCLKVCMCQ